jgi:hypothetical protein
MAEIATSARGPNSDLFEENRIVSSSIGVQGMRCLRGFAATWRMERPSRPTHEPNAAMCLGRRCGVGQG